MILCRLYDKDHELRMELPVTLTVTNIFVVRWSITRSPEDGDPFSIAEWELFDTESKRSMCRRVDGGVFGNRMVAVTYDFAWDFNFALGDEPVAHNWQGPITMDGKRITSAAL